MSSIDQSNKKRKVLTWDEKKQLCGSHERNPSFTYKELDWKFEVAENTVCNILKDKDKWLSVNPDNSNEQKYKTSKYPELESLFYHQNWTSSWYQKNQKKRITILLTMNATGTVKPSPLFIHKYQTPRDMNQKMVKENKNNLLLFDNAPVHILDERILLTNITLHNLPPNTITTHLQPADSGVINSFKVKYNK
nr:13608_t:CDS:2 [Entrophospora candida]